MDIRGYRKALDEYCDAYRYDHIDEDAEALRRLGKGFEEFDVFLAHIDTEVERVLGDLDSLEREQPPPDRKGPDDIPEPLRTDRERDIGDRDMDILNDPNRHRVPEDDPDDRETEEPDEADGKRRKEEDAAVSALPEVGKALAEVDAALALEVEARKTLKEAVEQWQQLQNSLEGNHTDPNELEGRKERLEEELEACREVQQAAEREIDRWRGVEDFRRDDTIIDITRQAAELKKKHRLALFPRRMIRRTEKLMADFHDLAKKAHPRLRSSQDLYQRAKAAIAAKEREIQVLESRLGKERNLLRENEEAGDGIWERLQALHRALRNFVGPRQPEPATGRKQNGQWELEFTDEQRVMHPVVAKRLESVRRCRELCRTVAQVHPPMEELVADTLNTTHVFPNRVRVGTTQWCHSGPGVELDIPELAEFPGKGPLLVPGADWVAPLLLRLAWAMPLGHLEIVALDQERAGQNILPVNDLSDVPGLLKVVTRPDGLQDALGGLEAHMGELATRCFKHGITDWAVYNARHPIHPLPCKVLAVCSLAGFDTWMSLGDQLKRILENGSRHGIFAILSKDALDASEARTKESLKGFSFQKVGASPGSRYQRLRGESFPPELPEDAGRLMAGIAEAAKKKAERPAKGFGELFAGTPMWSGKSADGLSAVIGWDAAGRPVRFKLDTGDEGGTGVHALVGGQTGSGKSVLLHALIHSLGHAYGPDELQFFLFDFKNGVELRQYADAQGRVWLPHVRLVSIQNDPRYALELFQYLAEVEFKKRNEWFKKARVKNIGEYVRRGGRMPRLVVVVDEFQELFKEHDGENVGGEIKDGLLGILKQGRNVGVHLVLATQTMASAHTMMKGQADDVMQQIGVRLALWGTGEEGILASNNRMSVTEITAKKQCILNAKTGLAGANTVFDFPFAASDSAEAKAYRARIEDTCRRKCFRCDGRLFNGTELPAPMAGMALRTALSKANETVHFTVALGVLPDFASTPVNVEFDNLAGEHLLVGGEDAGKLAGDLLPTEVWAGLRASVLRSLAATQECEVLYYNPGSAMVPSDLPPRFLRATSRTGEEELLTLFRQLLASRALRKVVFVENFHKAGILHPQEPQPSVPLFGKAPEPPKETARTLFLKAFTASGVPPFNAILFTKNVMFSCKNVLGKLRSEANILEACYKRIAFNVTGDTLKLMIPAAEYGQQHGPRRVWYEDRKTGSMQAFVPYAEK